jgi:hypothetical protein
VCRTVRESFIQLLLTIKKLYVFWTSDDKKTPHRRNEKLKKVLLVTLPQTEEATWMGRVEWKFNK